MATFTDKQQHALKIAAHGLFVNWKQAGLHVSTLTSLAKREMVMRDGDVYGLTTDGMIAAETLCEGVTIAPVVETAPIVDVKALIATRLKAVDDARERAKHARIYVYTGKIAKGEIAEPPSMKNVVVRRECDVQDSDLWAYSTWRLHRIFEEMTDYRGPNVRRWK